MRWARPAWGPIPLRLVMGLILIDSGAEKIAGISHTILEFTKLGFPLPGVLAWGIALLEFSGGLTLGVGLFVRYLGAIFAVEFTVAFLWAKLPIVGYAESRIDLLLIAAGVALFFLGAGPWSIDASWSASRTRRGGRKGGNP